MTQEGGPDSGCVRGNSEAIQATNGVTGEPTRLNVTKDCFLLTGYLAPAANPG
jgi:hypothetical protein